MAKWPNLGKATRIEFRGGHIAVEFGPITFFQCLEQKLIGVAVENEPRKSKFKKQNEVVVIELLRLAARTNAFSEIRFILFMHHGSVVSSLLIVIYESCLGLRRFKGNGFLVEWRRENCGTRRLVLFYFKCRELLY